MRTFGRVTQNGVQTWVVVETDASGSEDYIWLTTLIQCLKLNLNESPFFAQYGIPAQSSIVQQVAPDFYVWRTQSLFAPKFASLIISRLPGVAPRYEVDVVLNNGTRRQLTVAT